MLFSFQFFFQLIRRVSPQTPVSIHILEGEVHHTVHLIVRQRQVEAVVKPFVLV